MTPSKPRAPAPHVWRWTDGAIVLVLGDTRVAADQRHCATCGLLRADARVLVDPTLPYGPSKLLRFYGLDEESLVRMAVEPRCEVLTMPARTDLEAFDAQTA